MQLAFLAPTFRYILMYSLYWTVFHITHDHQLWPSFVLLSLRSMSLMLIALSFRSLVQALIALHYFMFLSSRMFLDVPNTSYFVVTFDSNFNFRVILDFYSFFVHDLHMGTLLATGPYVVTHKVDGSLTGLIYILLPPHPISSPL